MKRHINQLQMTMIHKPQKTVTLGLNQIFEIPRAAIEVQPESNPQRTRAPSEAATEPEPQRIRTPPEDAATPGQAVHQPSQRIHRNHRPPARVRDCV